MCPTKPPGTREILPSDLQLDKVEMPLFGHRRQLGAAFCLACIVASLQHVSAVPLDHGVERKKSSQTNHFDSLMREISDLNSSEREIVEAKMWRPEPEFPGGTFPEFTRREITDRPSTGVCFSGGGYRSYIATLGYLRGLLDLGLLKDIRYMFGISGGSWAVLLFSYYARGGRGVAQSDEELLGNITAPEEQTIEKLSQIPSTCARRSATAWMVERIVRELIKELRGARQLSRVWRAAVGEVFLRRFGIDPSAVLAYDDAQVAAILSRNPHLSPRRFATLLPGRPLPVVGITMLGPTALEPFPPRQRRYRLLEVSPFYVGSPHFGNVTFESRRRCERCEERVAVGGFVEPMAFGGRARGAARAQPGAESEEVEVEVEGGLFSIGDAAGTGSYAPGGFFSSSPELAWLGKAIGIEFNYFSPAAHDVNTPAAFADGGDMISPHLIGLLQRGVRSIVFFGNFATPLRPSAEWDPFARAPTAADIDDDIPPFFGIVLQDLGERTSYEFRYNQVFPRADFPRVVSALQAAQARGDGIVATTELETVGNRWWGLAGGFRVNVTWVYMSRVAAWEQRLPAPLRSLVLPEQKAADPTRARRRGPFAGFPYYGTGKLYYDAKNANLLADLCGWVVKRNADALRAALQAPPAAQPAGPRSAAAPAATQSDDPNAPGRQGQPRARPQ